MPDPSTPEAIEIQTELDEGFRDPDGSRDWWFTVRNLVLWPDHHPWRPPPVTGADLGRWGTTALLLLSGLFAVCTSGCRKPPVPLEHPVPQFKATAGYCSTSTLLLRISRDAAGQVVRSLEGTVPLRPLPGGYDVALSPSAEDDGLGNAQLAVVSSNGITTPVLWTGVFPVDAGTDNEYPLVYRLTRPKKTNAKWWAETCDDGCVLEAQVTAAFDAPSRIERLFEGAGEAGADLAQATRFQRGLPDFLTTTLDDAADRIPQPVAGCDSTEVIALVEALREGIDLAAKLLTGLFSEDRPERLDAAAVLTAAKRLDDLVAKVPAASNAAKSKKWSGLLADPRLASLVRSVAKVEHRLGPGPEREEALQWVLLAHSHTEAQVRAHHEVLAPLRDLDDARQRVSFARDLVDPDARELILPRSELELPLTYRRSRQELYGDGQACYGTQGIAPVPDQEAAVVFVLERSGRGPESAPQIDLNDPPSYAAADLRPSTSLQLLCEQQETVLIPVRDPDKRPLRELDQLLHAWDHLVQLRDPGSTAPGMELIREGLEEALCAATSERRVRRITSLAEYHRVTQHGARLFHDLPLRGWRCDGREQDATKVVRRFHDRREALLRAWQSTVSSLVDLVRTGCDLPEDRLTDAVPDMPHAIWCAPPTTLPDGLVARLTAGCGGSRRADYLATQQRWTAAAKDLRFPPAKPSTAPSPQQLDLSLGSPVDPMVRQPVSCRADEQVVLRISPSRATGGVVWLASLQPFKRGTLTTEGTSFVAGLGDLYVYTVRKDELPASGSVLLLKVTPTSNGQEFLLQSRYSR